MTSQTSHRPYPQLPIHLAEGDTFEIEDNPATYEALSQPRMHVLDGREIWYFMARRTDGTIDFPVSIEASRRIRIEGMN